MNCIELYPEKKDNGSYTPSYSTKVMGDDDYGYVTVPDNFTDFTEMGGYSDNLLQHQQYYDGYRDILSHYTYSDSYISDIDAQMAYLQIQILGVADTYLTLFCNFESEGSY